MLVSRTIHSFWILTRGDLLADAFQFSHYFLCSFIELALSLEAFTIAIRQGVKFLPEAKLYDAFKERLEIGFTQ